MKKIIKLTESELINLIKRVIKENDSYYDQILDLYNEVGMEGMTKEEIEYLKSGGSSELPDRFKTEEEPSVESDDEHFAIQWENLDKLKKIVERLPTEVEFFYDNLPAPSNLYFVLIFDFKTKLFDFLISKFGDKPIENTKIRPVKLKDDKIWLSIPKSWFDELFSDPS